MKRKTFLTLTLAFFFAAGFLSGCSQKSADAPSEKPALVINELQLTPSELKQEFRAGEGGESEWINRIIDREVLVQEAQRLGLDRQPEFIRTIERFWKEALIKSLLDQKAKTIENEVHVYDAEVEQYYKQLAASQGASSIEPLEEIREELRRAVRQNKQTEAMDKWIAELKAKAKISMDREALDKLKTP